MIVTYPLNGIQYGAEDAETYLSTRTSGIFSSEGQFAISAIGGRTLQISPGLAWINNSDFKGKSVAVTEAETIDVPTSHAQLARKDLLVLRFDASANSSYFAIKSGNAASSPLAPSVERSESIYELGLYIINVPANSLDVSSTDIESVLLDENYCGIMRDGVTGIPTAQLQEQVEELIDDLRQSVGNVVSVTATVDANIGTPSVDVSFSKDENGDVTISFDFHNIKAEANTDYATKAGSADYATKAGSADSVSGSSVTVKSASSAKKHYLMGYTTPQNGKGGIEMPYGRAEINADASLNMGGGYRVNDKQVIDATGNPVNVNTINGMAVEKWLNSSVDTISGIGIAVAQYDANKKVFTFRLPENKTKEDLIKVEAIGASRYSGGAQIYTGGAPGSWSPQTNGYYAYVHLRCMDLSYNSTTGSPQVVFESIAPTIVSYTSGTNSGLFTITFNGALQRALAIELKTAMIPSYQENDNSSFADGCIILYFK